MVVWTESLSLPNLGDAKIHLIVPLIKERRLQSAVLGTSGMVLEDNRPRGFFLQPARPFLDCYALPIRRCIGRKMGVQRGESPFGGGWGVPQKHLGGRVGTTSVDMTSRPIRKVCPNRDLAMTGLQPLTGCG